MVVALFLTRNSVTDKTEWASAGLKFCDSLTHIQVVFQNALNYIKLKFPTY